MKPATPDTCQLATQRKSQDAGWQKRSFHAQAAEGHAWRCFSLLEPQWRLIQLLLSRALLVPHECPHLDIQQVASKLELQLCCTG